jgi:tetratricopeptide (TPR) repeat protein
MYKGAQGMETKEKKGHFIGREQEIQQFTTWLHQPDAPWILYFHDKTEEPEKKGGIGKTWLLRQCAQEARQHPDIGVLMVDFFSVDDRDRLFLADKIVRAFHDLCPRWEYPAFAKIREQYDSKKMESANVRGVTDIAEDETTFTAIAAALVEDIQRLEPILVEEHKTLLIIFDTFEVIEDNPIIAVLRSSQTFPDTYGSSRMKILMAGRNRLNWNHPNWRGRQEEVQNVTLYPFNEHEMLDYIDAEAIYSLPPQDEQQIAALYKRTEGRPIMIGLVVDVLNNRIQSLDELMAIAEQHFEEYLIPQINKIENPINWVVLFMAHAYHHFNLTLLEQILDQVSQLGPIHRISGEEIARKLPQLSFVRRASTGDSFVLHDEMRRLVVKYCWEGLDPDKRLRKDISRSIIKYYSQPPSTEPKNEAWQQLCNLVILHHRLFIDLEDGLKYFRDRFQIARRLRKRGLARLLFQEVQNFASSMSPTQRDETRLAEAQLLRLEDAPDEALNVLEKLTQEHDQQWYEENYYEILNEQGRCYYRKNFWGEAENYLKKCLNIITEYSDKKDFQDLRGALLNMLGYIERRRGHFDEALAYYQQSADLFKTPQTMHNYANVLNNMSFVYRYQGKFDEALLHCKIAWRIRWQLFQKGEIGEIEIGLSLSTLGAIHLSAKDIADAERRFKAAYEIYVRADSKREIASTCHRLGQIQFERKNFAEALTWFEQAQHLAIESNVEFYIMSLIWQGRVYREQQQLEVAQSFFERAIERARRVVDNYQVVEGSIYLAECLAAQDKTAEYQRIVTEAEQDANIRNYYELLARIEFLQGDVLYHKKEEREAFRHFTAYCRYMALYNHGEYDDAIQKLVDALIGIPGQEETRLILHDITDYWQEHDLGKDYPELLVACSEVKELFL